MSILRALVLLVLVLSTTVAGADRIGDLLFEVQLVPLDGQPAPAFSLSGLDGKPVSLADFKNQVVFLYFWGAW
jgi:hypothetical protein